jgi:hypothetical protein
MQEINRFRGKMIECFVESHPQKRGKVSIELFVVALQFLVNRPVVSSGLGIALPAVDREAAGGQTVIDHALAHGEIGVAEMGSEFDHNVGSLIQYQAVGQRQVANPRRRGFFDMLGAEVPRSDQAD